MRVVIASIVLAAPLALVPAAHAQLREDPYAKAAIQTGDFDLAERKLLAEQRIFPDKPEVLLNLAALYAKTGRHAQARAAYQRVLAVEPVAMDLADGQVAASTQIANRGLRLLDGSRSAAR
jgi:Flp pilus assembly protein TadD